MQRRQAAGRVEAAPVAASCRPQLACCCGPRWDPSLAWLDGGVRSGLMVALGLVDALLRTLIGAAVNAKTGRERNRSDFFATVARWKLRPSAPSTILTLRS